MATTDRLVHTGEDAAPGDSAMLAVVTQLEAEVRGLRARLREMEAVVGPPARPGQVAAPTMPELLARVRALERRAGIVPGLDPLPDYAPAPRGEEVPLAHGAVSRLLEIFVVLSLLAAIIAFPVRPWGHGVRLADPSPTRSAAATSPVLLAVPAARPGGPLGVRAGESPCLLGAAAPCDALQSQSAATPVSTLPVSATERLPAARPGFHCGIILPPDGQECDQEGLRLP